MENTETIEQKRTAKDPYAYARQMLERNPSVIVAEVISIDGETKSGQKRYTLRLTVARPIGWSLYK